MKNPYLLPLIGRALFEGNALLQKLRIAQTLV
jgi:hypothetical protein